MTDRAIAQKLSAVVEDTRDASIPDIDQSHSQYLHTVGMPRKSWLKLQCSRRLSEGAEWAHVILWVHFRCRA